jgi:radical SAM superfamily enzyme YgiQ (UPF0313 family)
VPIKQRIVEEQITGGTYCTGGAPCYSHSERTLDEFPLFDILALGEGEITFKEIIEA